MSMLVADRATHSRAATGLVLATNLALPVVTSTLVAVIEVAVTLSLSVLVATRFLAHALRLFGITRRLTVKHFLTNNTDNDKIDQLHIQYNISGYIKFRK